MQAPYAALLFIMALIIGNGATAAQAQDGPFARLRAYHQMQEQDALLGQNDYHLSLIHDGIARQFNVHLPANLTSQSKAQSPLPVVIYMHGGGGSIAAAYKDKMDQEADRLGFALVVPAGTGADPTHFLVWNIGHWNNMACCGYAYEHNIDDVGFISEMIDTVVAKFPVDPARIYATGISNGGLMSYLVGCKLPDKIAAVAPVAPPGIPDACADAPPVALIHIHGTGDLFAKYYGGAGGTLFPNQLGACAALDNNNTRGPCIADPAEQQASEWLTHNQCSSTSTLTYHKGAATCVDYGSCAEGKDFSFCKIEGGGHAWPSGAQYAPASLIGPVSYDMSFDQIWDFLKRHRLQ